MLPTISGEFGVVADPEPSFSDKGNAWLRLRLVAKDRVRDSNGAWADGDPMWMNAVVFGKQAEHLTDSVMKGDTVIVVGDLAPNVWTDKDGVERKDVQIKVREIGVSVRWRPAKVQRDDLPPQDRQAPQDDAPPF
jgi:single-strand DNA-binding protein